MERRVGKVTDETVLFLGFSYAYDTNSGVGDSVNAPI